MDYITQPKDYWIAQNAINITRNVLNDPNRIQCSVASGAVILCYIENVVGLGYDNGHRFRTWPLSISPTKFNSNTAKYVYVAIPRTSSVGTQAVVVFPSEKLDIYGVNESDAQIGSTDYYYIWLQGILTATDGTSNREWQQAIDFGKKGTDEDLYDDTSSDWYQYSKVNNVVTFLKNIRMKAGTTFHNLILGNKELTGVATSDIAYTDSDALVATPGYVESQYLSKTHESTAQEQIGFLKGLWIGVRNLYEITANGIAKLKSVIAEDITAQRMQTGEIKSPNYTGDGVADTGFRLTNSHNGHSKLTIDEIYVRMKAIFESLEVRERTYTGGDQIWSCAGNRIVRVDYLGNVEDDDHVPQMMNVHADGRPEGQGQGDVYSVPVPGDTYGYSDVKVPWLLRQMPLLARAKVFARYRKVRIVINEPAGNSANRAAAADSPLANIRRARCYFIAKDDDMEVHNWWRINDLARCQTMNLANTTRKTYLSGEDQKAGNIFWWRKVIGVSYEPVKLDDGKEYHYFDVAFDYLLEQEHPEEMATSVMEGSDIPAASDSVVQFGNTIIEGRMNLMMMEVNGGDAVGYTPTTDAPCLKAYRGIYCFDLNKCWVGGSPRKMMLSPKSGYEFYGPNFKQVTEYDVVPVPVERGLWLDIVPTRDDYREHEMVRKCYYYDKVSHNGSYWLCSIVDGAHWVDGNGDYISDAAYSALTEAQKALCSRKQNYTIEEPSADSIDWTEVVKRGDKGDNMIRLDINNEMDMIPTTSALRIDVARMVETTVRLFDGSTEVDISAATLSPTGGPASSIATFSQSADGSGKKLSWAFKAGQTMAEAYEITISYTYKNVAYTAVFTVSASKGEAVWQLKPSMSAIPFQRNADNTLTPASREVGLSLLKIDGGSTATYTSVQTGLTVRYSTSSMPSSVSAGTGWSSGDITVANTADNLYIAMFNTSGVLLDRETIPVIKDGEKGSDGSYYVEDYGIGASRTSHSDISSWSSTPPSPTSQKPYVWKRSRLYNPNTNTYGNATYVCLTGEKGVNGKDGWMITANPANVIITQSLNNNTSSFSSATVSFTAKKGNVDATISSLAIPTGQQVLSAEFNAALGTGDDAKKVIVSSPKTYTPQGGTAQYYTEGTFVVDVIVTDPDTGSSVTFNVAVPCYANLLGIWKETVEAGVKHEVATAKFYFKDENGNVVAYETIGDYIKSSTQSISRLAKTIDDGKNLLTVTKGWEGYGGAAVQYDNKYFGVKSSDTLYSPVRLGVEGEQYCFSAYVAVGSQITGNPGFCYGTSYTHASDLDDNGTYQSATFIEIPGDTITIGSTTYQRYYFRIPGSIVKDCYFTIHNDGGYWFFCPQLEVGALPTAFSAGSIETSSQIKQTADEIDLSITNKLGQTGINIQGNNRTVDVQADHFNIHNSNNERVMGVDSYGNMYIKGAIQYDDVDIVPVGGYVYPGQAIPLFWFNQEGKITKLPASTIILNGEIDYFVEILLPPPIIERYNQETDEYETIFSVIGMNIDLIIPARAISSSNGKIVLCVGKVIKDEDLESSGDYTPIHYAWPSSYDYTDGGVNPGFFWIADGPTGTTISPYLNLSTYVSSTAEAAGYNTLRLCAGYLNNRPMWFVKSFTKYGNVTQNIEFYDPQQNHHLLKFNNGVLSEYIEN